jgi:hypothetical protein
MVHNRIYRIQRPQDHRAYTYRDYLIPLHLIIRAMKDQKVKSDDEKKEKVGSNRSLIIDLLSQPTYPLLNN